MGKEECEVVTYEEAVQAQLTLEDQLLKNDNVVSIGVVEEISQGNKTGGYVIQVGVNLAEISQHSVAQREQQAIPTQCLIPASINKEKEKYVRIAVINEGKIQALHASSPNSKKTEVQKIEIPSAKNDLPSDDVLDKTTRRKQRPTPCGYSIGHFSITAGTIGALLQYTQGDNTDKAYILSNNHVLAASNAACIGDQIIQPGKHDAGIVGVDTLGYLHRWVPLQVKGVNYVDAAVAEVCGDKDWPKYVVPHISNIGDLGDFSEAAIGMPVEKTGRTTNHTEGKIVSINETIKVNYCIGDKDFVLIFKGQIRTNCMSEGGDSGSCLVTKDSNKNPVGLLFAGNAEASYFNRMGLVLSSLSNKHINEHPLNKNKTIFEETHPFKIIKRFYSSEPSFSHFRNNSFKVSTIFEKFSFSIRHKPLLAASCLGIYAMTTFLLRKNKTENIPARVMPSPRPLTFLFNPKPDPLFPNSARTAFSMSNNRGEKNIRSTTKY